MERDSTAPHYQTYPATDKTSSQSFTFTTLMRPTGQLQRGLDVDPPLPGFATDAGDPARGRPLPSSSYRVGTTVVLSGSRAEMIFERPEASLSASVRVMNAAN